MRRRSIHRRRMQRRQTTNVPVGRLAMLPGLVVTALVAIFGVFFARQAGVMGAPLLFVVFGIGFTIFGVMAFISTAAGIAKGNEGEATLYDDEEPDILYRPEPLPGNTSRSSQQVRECAYCGTRVDDGGNRCPNCGAGI